MSRLKTEYPHRPRLFFRARRTLLAAWEEEQEEGDEASMKFRRREEVMVVAWRLEEVGGGYRKPSTNATAPLSFYNRKAHISQLVSPHA